MTEQLDKMMRQGRRELAEMARERRTGPGLAWTEKGDVAAFYADLGMSPGIIDAKARSRKTSLILEEVDQDHKGGRVNLYPGIMGWSPREGAIGHSRAAEAPIARPGAS